MNFLTGTEATPGTSTGLMAGLEGKGASGTSTGSTVESEGKGATGISIGLMARSAGNDVSGTCLTPGAAGEALGIFHPLVFKIGRGGTGVTGTGIGRVPATPPGLLLMIKPAGGEGTLHSLNLLAGPSFFGPST